MAQGICNAIYPVDDSNVVAKPPLTPSDPKSVDIYFEMNTTLTVLPQDQLDLLRDCGRFNHVLGRVFPPGGKFEQRFRQYYVQLFELAGLGLVGPNAMPDIARRALESMTAELVESESDRIKNAYLKTLTITGLKLAAPFAVVYALVRWFPGITRVLGPLGIDRLTFGNFMLIWLGCFLGVVLSYGIRTQQMKLDDLLQSASDTFAPFVRHLFAGGMTMVIGLMLMKSVFTLKIGDLSTDNLTTVPVVAFLVGVVCGISELVLPAVLKKYSGGLPT